MIIDSTYLVMQLGIIPFGLHGNVFLICRRPRRVYTTRNDLGLTGIIIIGLIESYVGTQYECGHMGH
jgi:hypothetical protein